MNTGRWYVAHSKNDNTPVFQLSQMLSVCNLIRNAVCWNTHRTWAKQSGWASDYRRRNWTEYATSQHRTASSPHLAHTRIEGGAGGGGRQASEGDAFLIHGHSLGHYNRDNSWLTHSRSQTNDTREKEVERGTGGKDHWMNHKKIVNKSAIKSMSRITIKPLKWPPLYSFLFAKTDLIGGCWRGEGEGEKSRRRN